MAEERRTRPRPTSTTTRRRAPSERGPERAARAACERLAGLISHRPEGVSGVRRTDDGWCVVVDVLEVPRIPDTTSLLASYEVQLTQDGELLEYRRIRRYRRGAADE
ncbi:gas vesicle protein [Streptomyces sp. AK02-01A]|uniref:gas vesicle protein GvpO n=1 Tax=Streptomyces sp. AK02-01A TaxID=3028648 RepID=UPI0029A72586|nr:gas vesicle protein [Streptomyces sp. AK02-01A]MDX3850964.1 gas vesicle protein [Streptomyces sp. AK02-01A]